MATRHDAVLAAIPILVVFGPVAAALWGFGLPGALDAAIGSAGIGSLFALGVIYRETVVEPPGRE